MRTFFLLIKKLFGPKKVLFTFIAVAASLALVEGAARLLIKTGLYWKYGGDASVFREAPLVFDEDEGWKWPEGHDFRGRGEVPREKPAGVYRVITSGDSCCWGAFVAREATFSARLETMLRRRYGGGRVEVLNGGVAGHSPQQVYEHVRKTLLGYHPDLVVNYGAFIHGPGFRVRDFNAGMNRRFARLNSLFFYSKACLLMNETFRLIKPADLHYGKIGPDQDTQEFIEMVRASGGQVMLVEYAGVNNSRITSDILGLEFTCDAPVVRTCQAFIGTGLAPRKLFSDDVHPTPLGHAVIAQQIFDEIVRQNLIKN